MKVLNSVEVQEVPGGVTAGSAGAAIGGAVGGALGGAVGAAVGAIAGEAIADFYSCNGSVNACNTNLNLAPMLM
jgi:outer membrane lipoprotein SlyB